MKNKNTIVLITLFLLFILIRLVLLSSFVPYIRAGYRFDDVLMFDMAKNLVNGNYLGSYSELTLVKGFVYPLFVAFFDFLRIPYLIGFDIIFITSSIIFSLSMKKYLKKDYLVLFLFIILILNPISYAKDTYLLFYRNGFNISMILLFFGTLINYHSNSNKKNGIFLGIAFFLMMMTREDYMWVAPALVVILIITKNKLFNKIIPVLTVFILILLVSTTNYIKYDAFTINEFSNSQFKVTYDKIMSIVNNDKDKIDTLAKLEIASKNSPSFFPLYKEMESYGVLNAKNFDGGNTIWAIREAGSELGYFESYETGSSLFKKIANELDKANQKGLISYSNMPQLTVTAPLTASMVIQIPKDTIKVLPQILGYKDVKIEDGFTRSTYDFENDFKKMVNGSITPTNMYLDDAKFVKVMILNSNLMLYQRIWLIVSLLGITSYIYLIIKKESVVIESIILFSTGLFILGLVYTNISSFPTLRYYYLAPSYLFSTVFFSICIMRAGFISKLYKIIRKQKIYSGKPLNKDKAF